MITSTEKASYFRSEADLPRIDIQPGLKSFASATVKAVRSAEYSNLLSSPEDVIRTIAIDNVGVESLEFDLRSKPDKYNELLLSGWKSTCAYFGVDLEFPEQYKMILQPSLSPQ